MKKLIAVLTLVAAVAGCGSSSSKPSSSTASSSTASSSTPPPRFVSVVDNPWFPLRPGTTFRYRGVKDGKPSRDVVVVESATKTIEGVPCTVVTDLL
ncbi:MAG TPA: hypothetical protein VGC98_08325, partial [Thermoleophilaceae bacterium]